MAETPKSAKELIKSERSFLHGMATPLMIASGSIDALAGGNLDPEKAADRLAKASRALGKMSQLLKDHRAEIVALDEITPE